MENIGQPPHVQVANDPLIHVKNPLGSIRLSSSIDENINKHIQTHNGMFNSQMEKRNFYQFLVGVLTSVRSSPNENLRNIYIRKNVDDNNSLRFFAIFEDRVVVHDVGAGGPIRMITNGEHSSLKASVLRNDQLNLEEMTMKLKQYEVANHDTVIRMNVKYDMDVQYSDERPIKKMRGEKVDLIHIVKPDDDSVVGTLKTATTHKNVEIRKKIVVAASNTLSKLNAKLHGSMDKNGLLYSMHGLVTSSMSHIQYKHVLELNSMSSNILPSSSVLWLPAVGTSEPRHLLVDFRDVSDVKRNYELAQLLGSSAELHFMRPHHRENKAPAFNQEVVKWNTGNIIYNLVKSIKEFQPDTGNNGAMNAKKQAYMEVLIHRKKSVLENGQISDGFWRFFLIGEFRTSSDASFYLPHKENSISIKAMMIKYNGIKVLLTFDEQRTVKQGFRHVIEQSHHATNIIGINFGQEQWSLFAETVDDIRNKYGDFKFIPSKPIGSLLSKMSLNNQHEKSLSLSRSLHSTMDYLLKDVRKTPMPNEAIAVYVKGLFSDIMSQWRFEGSSEPSTFALHFLVKGVQKVFNFRFLLYNNAKTDVVQQTLMQGMNLKRLGWRNPNTLVISYNNAALTNRLAIMGVDAEAGVYTSPNVASLCLNMLRRNKRSSLGDVCHIMKKNKAVKTTYDTMEARTVKEYPRLHKGINKIYKLSTKIQMGIVAKDMLSHLIKGDFESFGVDVLFFGLTVASPSVAERIAKWGRKGAVKVAEKVAKNNHALQSIIKKIGWRIGTVGRCLPTIGFTAYSMYQLHEQINNGDTVSAAFTGASIAIDLLGCALEAAVLLGLVALSPIIFQIMAIISTALIIAQRFYEAWEGVKEISDVIPLTWEEHRYSFMRQVLMLGNDPLLKSIANQRQANEVWVANVLEMFPGIDRFLISAGADVDEATGIVSYIEDSIINMTKWQEVEVSRTMPRPDKIPTGYELFCQMDERDLKEKKTLEQTMKSAEIINYFPQLSIIELIHDLIAFFSEQKMLENNPKIWDWHCVNAFGIQKKNVSFFWASTAFLLFNGTDRVSGFKYSPNIMVLGNGKKHIHGGLKSDKFVMIGNLTFGHLDASDGEDAIDFKEYATNKASTIMTIENSTVFLSSSVDEHEPLVIKNFENFIGRQNLTDRLQVCNYTIVDLRGAANQDYPDLIRIDNDEKCQLIKNLTIYLRNNTLVECAADGAIVNYVATREDYFEVNTLQGSHNFTFKSTSLTDVRLKNDDKLFLIQIGHSDYHQWIMGSEDAEVKLNFEMEKIVAKLNRGRIIATINDETLFYQMIENYAAYINKNPNVDLMAQTSHGNVSLSRDNSTIHLNGEQYGLNIVVVEDEQQNFYGKSGMVNYFLIRKESSVITIDSQSGGKSPIYIDLKYFSTIENEHDTRMVAVRDENNIKISVMVLPLLNTSLESDEITMITIINGFPYMNQISIYLSQECKFTNLNDQLLIQPLPIYVSEREYYLHPDQFDFQSKIIFTYEVGDLEAYIINNTLQITNVALIDQLFDDDLVILTFIDFFIYKRKYETLNLAFNDKVINLGALETLGEPVDFSIMWERMEERLDAHEAMAENEEEMNDQMEEIMAY